MIIIHIYYTIIQYLFKKLGVNKLFLNKLVNEQDKNYNVPLHFAAKQVGKKLLNTALSIFKLGFLFKMFVKIKNINIYYNI